MYTLDGHILQQVQNNPYLGLQISEDLKWTTHITNVAKKANSTLGFLRRNLRFCPKECKKTPYISLVRSTMEYGAIAWDPYTTSDINKLERIQRRAARFITGDYKTREEGSVTKMLNDLKNLQLRRTSLRLVFLHKVVESLVPAINPSELLVKGKPKRKIKPKRFDNFESANIVNNSVKNNSKALETTVCNTEQYKNSFFVKSVIHWNQLDEEIVHAQTVESFKTALQNLLSITKRKPEHFYYNLHGHILESVDSAKYLGIILQSNLKWNKHIDQTASKAQVRVDNTLCCPPPPFFFFFFFNIDFFFI